MLNLKLKPSRSPAEPVLSRAGAEPSRSKALIVVLPDSARFLGVGVFRLGNFLVEGAFAFYVESRSPEGGGGGQQKSTSIVNKEIPNNLVCNGG